MATKPIKSTNPIKEKVVKTFKNHNESFITDLL